MYTFTAIQAGALKSGALANGTAVGQMVKVVNLGIATETLTTTGNLQLRSPAVAFDPGASMDLFWDGAVWQEISRRQGRSGIGDVTEYATDSANTVAPLTKMVFGTAIPQTGAWSIGDRILYRGSAVSAGGAEGKICITAGTYGKTMGTRHASPDGVLASVTLDTKPTGANAIAVGDQIAVDSVPFRVLSISDNGLTLGLDGVPASASNKLVTYPTAAWKDFGAIAS